MEQLKVKGSDPRHVIIHGLRRSGTTILWQSLRSARALRCYDEPFHPRLARGDLENHKGTWTEFAELSQRICTTFEPVPIAPVEELNSVSSDAQIKWLAQLTNSHSTTVVDIVRGWNRVPELHEQAGKVLTVHLVRDPVGWAASHLLPSGASTFRRAIAGAYRRSSFFWRNGFYDGYQYETIIDHAIRTNHPVLSHVALSHSVLSREPAYVKLLAFWWGANVTLAQGMAKADLPRLTITLQAFAESPDKELSRIVSAAHLPSVAFNTESVYPLPSAFGAGSYKWDRALARLKVPDEVLNPDICSTRLAYLFEAGRI